MAERSRANVLQQQKQNALMELPSEARAYIMQKYLSGQTLDDLTADQVRNMGEQATRDMYLDSLDPATRGQVLEQFGGNLGGATIDLVKEKVRVG